MTYFPLSTYVYHQVPESPIWLIAKRRPKDAEAALCWLRGWVDRSAVQQELAELLKYHDSITMGSTSKLETRNKSKCTPSHNLLPCNDMKSSNDHQAAVHMTADNVQLPSSEDETITIEETLEQETEMDIAGDDDDDERMTSTRTKKSIKMIGRNRDEGGKRLKHVSMVKLFLEPETLRPLVLTVCFFTFYGFGGMPSIRPFLVEVIERFQASLEGTWSTVSRLCYKCSVRVTVGSVLVHL